MNFPSIVLSYRKHTEIGSWCKGHYEYKTHIDSDIQTKLINSIDDLSRHIVFLDRKASEETEHVKMDDKKYWYSHLVIDKNCFDNEDIYDFGQPGEIIFSGEEYGDHNEIRKSINIFRHQEYERIKNKNTRKGAIK